MPIYRPTGGADDWRTFLADPEKQWRKGYSARTIAMSWEAAKGFPLEVARCLGANAECLIAIPEHKIPLPGGRRDSQCDVFALGRAGGRTYAISVEGKIAEPFGPTVEEWMMDASDGKRERLAFLCRTLGLSSEPNRELRYQLLHRTVAGIIEANRFGTDAAAMIVHSFSQDHQWFADFDAFAALLGVSIEPGGAGETVLPDGMVLRLGWAVGDPAFLET